MILVRLYDRLVLFGVRNDLEDSDDDIAENSFGCVILCNHDYTIYDRIDEYERIDLPLTFTHDDSYVIGDAHLNNCEKRQSFLCQWMVKF